MMQNKLKYTENLVACMYRVNQGSHLEEDTNAATP